MIKVLITGPQGSGKSKLAQLFISVLNVIGGVNYEVYTTNEDVSFPKTANRE